MHDKLASAVRQVAELENRLNENALSLRNSEFASGEFLEGRMIKQLPVQTPVSGNVCAIDSGLLAHATHGVDIVMARSVAVNFSYNNSGLVSCTYYPAKMPEPEIEIKTALDEYDTLIWRSLIRLKSEINAALEAIDKFSPAIVLLDGSILPLAKDRPGNDSNLFQDYSGLIGLYRKIYSLCKEKNIFLIGVIKDSRGKRFMSIVDKEKTRQESCNDSVFLNCLLRERERTSVMRYASDASRQPILKDLADFTDNIYICYMKITKNDRPMRIEFLNFDGDFEKQISLVHSLSAISENYAYPAALTEADLCAEMDERELGRLTRAFSNFGISCALRRNSRPFR